MDNQKRAKLEDEKVDASVLQIKVGTDESISSSDAIHDIGNASPVKDGDFRGGSLPHDFQPECPQCQQEAAAAAQAAAHATAHTAAHTAAQAAAVGPAPVWLPYNPMMPSYVQVPMGVLQPGPIFGPPGQYMAPFGPGPSYDQENQAQQEQPPSGPSSRYQPRREPLRSLSPGAVAPKFAVPIVAPQASIVIRSPITPESARWLKMIFQGQVKKLDTDIASASHMDLPYFSSPQGDTWRCVSCMGDSKLPGWTLRSLHCVGLTQHMPIPVCPGGCRRNIHHLYELTKCRACTAVFEMKKAILRGKMYRVPTFI